jgi:hypothetical protein
MNDQIVKRDKIAKLVKYGSAGLVALVVSPIIFLVIKGMVGLIMAAVLGFTAIQLAPWFAMKIANAKVKLIVSEAKENPIETMTNLLVEKRLAYATFKQSVEDAVTARNDFAQQVAEFKGKYPKRAAEFEQKVANMTTLVQRKKEALAAAKQMIDEGDSKLAEMKAYWDMSLAAQKANKASGMDTGDLYEKLKADTAVDAVFSSMNRAFAQLETEAAVSVTPDALTHQSADVIPIDIREGEKVQRGTLQ